MTQDEIIEMAMEAEFVLHGKPSEEESELFVCVDKDIVRFAKLVAAKAIADLESQEPVADDFFRMIADRNPKPFPLPQRTWVGLTDEEFHDLQIENIDDPWANFKAIEAKLKEKNCVG